MKYLQLVMEMINNIVTELSYGYNFYIEFKSFQSK